MHGMPMTAHILLDFQYIQVKFTVIQTYGRPYLVNTFITHSTEISLNKRFSFSNGINYHTLFGFYGTTSIDDLPNFNEKEKIIYTLLV